jgi:ABC-2 type transport system ATP-binding protein
MKYLFRFWFSVFCWESLAIFSLEEGRITGFIGRNGAGKTPTIKAVLNLIHPDSGRISYFGMPLAGNEAKIIWNLCYGSCIT